ncbi:MAG: undecaprenyldiphospho-muramoylpentapeptide beta-N-acetylglucosaminyltransferase [Thiobacillaceae bacterium]|jgi:UDP-N-acetylglucosamine--N-acetylmuramyl-(pentapeptide) pyrophosphoryl-undecaprenol N-acetylglucosamine transferase|nr:undecaprenyldiphospho-muramoylpentapeptide beta-N-acetylglucosaminyltransferase [Thiobacillaceae bacterium]
MNRTALIMAGGTGGHVMPALAVAERLRDEGWRVVWLGTHAGMEARLATEKGFDMAWVRVAGVRGKGLLTKLLLPMNLLAAFWQSARAIFRERPDVALGLGGYVAFPGGMMASLLGKPLAIHEQNAVAGLTNRILACLADRVLLGLPAAFTHGKDRPLPCRAVDAEWVGNPVRPAIAALPGPVERLAGRAGPLRLLVVGGSLGAAALNDLLPKALARLPADTRPLVRHQGGKGKLEQLKANYAGAGVDAVCLEFIADMAEAYAWADLVICRAGASTVAEIAAAGAAALFVPYPYAVDDHQTENARFLADAGGAWLMQQRDLTPEKLADWLASLTRTGLLERAGKARSLAKPEATARVAEVVKELAK